MISLAQLVNEVDVNQLSLDDYQRHFAGCLVKTHDGRLLLQKRGADWDRFPGMLATFGGQLDAGEAPIDGIKRELAEELGAKFGSDEALYLGAFTKVGLENALIHAYWWHDARASISGCYEGEPAYFDDAEQILAQAEITPDVFWIVNICLSRALIA